MSTFVATNIEYDNISEVEVDDTKELQIEEALKLYQTALKLHADGPSSYDEAAKAYRALFESDIFKWGESLTEFRRSDGLIEEEETFVDAQTAAGTQQVVVNTEAAPNTLPQILHLAYKNHGLFLLEVLQHSIKQHGSSAEGVDTIQTSKESLELFAQAVDKDDADVDLWRTSSTVANFVGSTRISRYCLEAVLDGDEEGLDGVLSLPSIDESFAVQKLRHLTTELGDDLVATTGLTKNGKIRQLAPRVVEKLEAFPSIPRPSFQTATYSHQGNIGREPARQVLKITRRDWSAVGEAIVMQLMLADSSLADPRPGAALIFDLPESIEGTSPTIEVAIRPLPESSMPLDAAKAEKATTIGSSTEDATPDVDMANDSGRTETGATDGADAKVDDQEKPEEQTLEVPEANGDSSTNPRKRSPDEAELPEAPEAGRLRSKRSKRNRETLDGGVADPVDANKQFELAMMQYVEADESLFDTIQQIFEPFPITTMGTSQSLRKLVAIDQDDHNEQREPLYAAVKDLFEVSQNCTPERAKVFASGENLNILASTPIEYSLQATIGKKAKSSDSAIAQPFDNIQGLNSWIDAFNKTWTYTNEAAWKWLSVFLRRGRAPGSSPSDPSSYLAHKWDETLKKSVVQVMVHTDEYITSRVQDDLRDIEENILVEEHGKDRSAWDQEDEATIDLIQTLFELHLDVYKKFKHPSSGIDQATLTAQKYRLEHWSTFAHTAINLRRRKNSSLRGDTLALRHLWATAFQISTLDDVSQTHVLAVMHDLKDLLISLDEAPIYLQNNAVMPDISVAAIDQELNEMNMQRFFQKVFSYNQDDPIAVIDSLEPILELQIQESEIMAPSSKTVGVADESSDSDELMADANFEEPSDAAQTLSPIVEVSRFLSKGSASLRLSLWQRLRMAYQAIDYQPKVLYCHLQSIVLIVMEITSTAYTDLDKASRALPLLHYLSLIEELIRRITEIQKTSSDAFEFVDEQLLTKALSSLQSVSRLLTTFNIYEDCVRVGQLPAPLVDNRPKAAFHTVANKMYDLQVRNWLLQYSLLKEAIEQKPEQFTAPKQDRLNFIRVVHHTMGLRGVCNSADKALLKVARDELLQLSDLDDFEFELGQVLYDLYGLKCTNPALLHDHRCPEAETITRSRALKLLGFIMAQANKVPLKDLHRTDLRLAIEKVHGFLTMQKPKASNEIEMNRRQIKAYIKSPLRPVNLFASLRGTLELGTRPVPDTAAPIAAKGWYSLMANLALGRFKTSRRNAPGSTEDLNAAISFFMQDLEFSAERWETWYSLAQCYDLQIEEYVSWTAEKLNGQFLAQPKDSFHEIIQAQRTAINFYAMAVSTAVRSMSHGSEARTKLGELYSDFAIRVYASSREPFSMQAFNFKDGEWRYFSSGQLYRRTPFNPAALFLAWKLSATLLKRSAALLPGNWHTHYMLAKCLWKLCHKKNKAPPKMQDVITDITTSIKLLPDKKGREPTLEPHYKLVSLTHKAVMRDDLTLDEGIKALQATSYAKKSEAVVDDKNAWSKYVLEVIKELEKADKSNWQHRIISRAARLRYSLKDEITEKASAAKDELTQQMFTKTMIIQAWRPEHERPGRHFVYTSRYLKYFSSILVQLRDRPNLEQLVRRLRRKPNDFFNHTELWAETVQAYLRMLRQVVHAPSGHEDTVFKSLTLDEFLANAALLEKWAHSPTASCLELDILKETIELKRMNLGLMKHTLIDDLVCDAYARLYEVEVERLLKEKAENKEDEPMKDVQSTEQDKITTNAADKQSDLPQQLPFSATNGVTTEDQSIAVVNKPVKIKGVGRRDIMRKAEQVVNRPVAATIASIPPKMPSTTTSVSHPQIVIPRRTSAAANLEKSRRSSTADRGASAPRTPSAQPDADDDSDSELSELDEAVVKEVERKAFMPLFPRLRASNPDGSVTEGSHMDADTDVEKGGDKDDDHEEEGSQDEEEGNEDDNEGEADDEGNGEDAELDDEENEGGDEQEDDEDNHEDEEADEADEHAEDQPDDSPEPERPKSQGFMTVQQGNTTRRTAPVDDSQEPLADEMLSDLKPIANISVAPEASGRDRGSDVDMEDA